MLVATQRWEDLISGRQDTRRSSLVDPQDACGTPEVQSHVDRRIPRYAVRFHNLMNVSIRRTYGCLSAISRQDGYLNNDKHSQNTRRFCENFSNTPV